MNISRTKLVGLGLAIFAVTVWLYWPSTQGGFLRVDDVEYLRQSIQRNGLTWDAVEWAFTCTDSYYHPLPRLSHVVDYQLWKRNPVGHHATSVLVHALNAALVFGFLWTLLGTVSLSTGERLLMALWVAAVFAVHPLQTESVAWMSGRTQLLCAMFGIGSVWAYVAGARRWLVGTLFVLAVLSKPMAVSFPFVMLALDCFPLQRQKQFGWVTLVREKAVLLGLAGTAAVATIITSASREHASLVPVAVVPLSVRVLRVFESLTFYLVKLVWPAHLSPNYLLDVSFGHGAAVLSVLTVLLITVVAAHERQRLPMLVAGWSAYVMLLLPVSGLVTAGRPVVELRYAYVAMLPVLLLAGAAVVWLWRHSRTTARVVLIGLLAGGLCALAADSRRLIPDWHNDEAMRRATVVAFPNSEQANRELATELSLTGRASEALSYAQRDVEIAPQDCEAHVMLALVLCTLNRPQEAIEQDQLALQINPHSARAHFSFGIALGRIGKTEGAMQHYEEALRLDPHLLDAQMSLANALLARGNLEEAIAHYRKALEISPGTTAALFNIGFALYQMGRAPEAIKEFEAALQIWPDYAEARYYLGLALFQVGQTQKAIPHYQAALRLSPDDPRVHYHLGQALYQVGQLSAAIGQFEQALRTKPDYVEAHVDLGTALAQIGDNAEALTQFTEALRLSPDSPEAHANLGAALLQAGQVSSAAEHFEQALRIKPDYVEAHFNLGLALEKMGHTPEAIEQYEQTLKLRPDFISATQALARLRTSQ